MRATVAVKCVSPSMTPNKELRPDVQQAPAFLRPVKRPNSGPLGGENRRSVKRYLVPLVFCQVLAPILTDDMIEVVDLSSSGICLSLMAPLELGDVLHLRLSNRQHLCIHEVTLRVTHRRGGGRGLCLAGGEFVEELPPEVLRALLG